MQKDSTIRLFRAVFIVVALLKIFLIADQEIYGQRFDDMGYALSMIDHYYGCDPNLNWLFIRPLGFPLFGAICMESGIPYRICIEMLFLAASYFFCTGLARIFRMQAVPIISLIVLVFHPWVLVGFNQLLTEPYFFSLILVILGIFTRLIAAEKWSWRNGWLWALGPVAALMMLTRREEPWLFGSMALVFLVHFATQRFHRRLEWKLCLLPMLLILIPIGSYQAVILGVSGMNYAKWGIFATNEQEAPGFSGILNVLYKIDTPDPSLWAPVTSKTLEMAMEASPRFALLRQGMFDQNNPHLEYGESTTGRKGELGAWMWWRLYDSLAASGIYTSPKAADEWMQETTRELETALADGRLPKRRFSTNFPIDPNVGIWLPEFPHLFLNTLKRLYYVKPEARFAIKEAEVPSLYSRIFDMAANRRESHLAMNSVEVAGHAFSSAGRLDFIAVENQAGETVAATAPQGTLYWKLPDIQKLTGKEELFETAFYINYIPRTNSTLSLSFWKDGERLHAYPLTQRQYPHRIITPDGGDLPRVDFTVTHFSTPYPDLSQSMRALLRGWAFSQVGPVTHVSLVNDKGQFLKLQPFNLEREDISGMYKEQLGSEAGSPLGFHIESPVLDESAITVQFWKDSLRVHEMPLAELPEGFWGTITDTLSGVPLVIGIGKRQIPEMLEETPTFRQDLRSRLIHGHYLYAALLAIVATVIGGFCRRRRSAQAPLDRWNAWATILVLGLFLLGRAGFYGLVEAAVVPGVERYMDCVSPIASVLLVLMVSMPFLLLFDRFHKKEPAIPGAEE